MTAESIITYLQGVGAVLSVEDGTLRIEAKKGTIKPDQVEQLKAHKAEIISLLQKPTTTRAKGYGCAGCGNRIYEAIGAWEISELPASLPWQYEHVPAIHWKCEGCGVVFQIIGGTLGPVLIQ